MSRFADILELQHQSVATLPPKTSFAIDTADAAIDQVNDVRKDYTRDVQGANIYCSYKFGARYFFKVLNFMTLGKLFKCEQHLHTSEE